MEFVVAAFWPFFLVGAYFYTRATRHPRTKPLAAYLIFVIVFTVTAFALFAGFVGIMQAAGSTNALDNPIVAALFVVLVFAPAFVLARWQMQKPPRSARSP